MLQGDWYGADENGSYVLQLKSDGTYKITEARKEEIDAEGLWYLDREQLVLMDSGEKSNETIYRHNLLLNKLKNDMDDVSYRRKHYKAPLVVTFLGIIAFGLCVGAAFFLQRITADLLTKVLGQLIGLKSDGKSNLICKSNSPHKYGYFILILVTILIGFIAGETCFQVLEFIQGEEIKWGILLSLVLFSLFLSVWRLYRFQDLKGFRKDLDWLSIAFFPLIGYFGSLVGFLFVMGFYLFNGFPSSWPSAVDFRLGGLIGGPLLFLFLRLNSDELC